jgi:hypothetical protein
MASLLAATCAFTWVMPPAKPNPYVRLTRAQVEMKHAPPVERVESEGTICEFEEGKNHRPFLGVIESSKIKGSNVVYQVVDAAGSKHSVASKYLHCAFPASPMTKPNTPTSEVLAPYVSVARCKSTELGIDLEMLDLAWEVLAEEEPASLSSTAIVSYIDESLVEAEGPEQYRVFRLLTSDLGQVACPPCFQSIPRPRTNGSLSVVADILFDAPCARLHAPRVQAQVRYGGVLEPQTQSTRRPGCPPRTCAPLPQLPGSQSASADTSIWRCRKLQLAVGRWPHPRRAGVRALRRASTQARQSGALCEGLVHFFGTRLLNWVETVEGSSTRALDDRQCIIGGCAISVDSNPQRGYSWLGR